MSSITAALAISQLEKFEKLVSLRRKNAKYLSSRLSKFEEIKVPKEPPGYYHVYQLYSILLPNMKIKYNLMKFLEKKGIMTKIFFYPLPCLYRFLYQRDLTWVLSNSCIFFLLLDRGGNLIIRGATLSFQRA